jgi:hypothetical protein
LQVYILEERSVVKSELAQSASTASNNESSSDNTSALSWPDSAYNFTVLEDIGETNNDSTSPMTVSTRGMHSLEIVLRALGG